MKWLITGTPHSGTRYMAFLFRAYGLDINHEAMGGDGTSCWSWGAPDAHRVAPPWSPGLRPLLDPKEWTVVHIHRDPVVCIPALAQDTKPETLELIHRFVPKEDDPLQRAAKTYAVWNLLIQDMKPDYTINVEDADVWARRHLGQRWLAEPPKNINSRAKGKRQAIDWEQIKPQVRSIIQQLARDRGYLKAA